MFQVMHETHDILFNSFSLFDEEQIMHQALHTRNEPLIS